MRKRKARTKGKAPAPRRRKGASTQAQNHPKKGSKIKVEPIRDLEAIARIREALKDKPRDLALFTVGINTNLRASDLVRIRVAQVRDLEPMDEIEINETKTRKPRRINLNSVCIEAIDRWLEARPDLQDQDILFTGQRGPLVPKTIHNLVKGWCRQIGLRGNYGSHTLRKTWGYHQRATFGAGIPELMVCFNHSSQRQTLDYLCIQPEEIRDIYANEL